MKFECNKCHMVVDTDKDRGFIECPCSSRKNDENISYMDIGNGTLRGTMNWKPVEEKENEKK